MLLDIEFSGCSEYFPKRRDQIVQHGNFVIKNVSKVDKNVSKKKIRNQCATIVALKFQK